jgi:hypothetical protein
MAKRIITKWQRRVWRYQRRNHNPCIEEDTKLKIEQHELSPVFCAVFFIYII